MLDGALSRRVGNSPAGNPRSYRQTIRPGAKLPDDFVVTPLQYVD